MTVPGEPGGPSGVAGLAALLSTHQDLLLAFMRREAGGLIRFEAAEDLVQGVHARALAEPERFEFRSAEEFKAWLLALARRHVADRHDHWSALKRGSGRIVRLTFSGSPTGDSGTPPPADSSPGPSTFAERREQLILAARALAVLLPRDRQLMRWMSEDLPLADQAARLGLSYDATQRAALRAVERFRKAYRLIARPR